MAFQMLYGYHVVFVKEKIKVICYRVKTTSTLLKQVLPQYNINGYGFSQKIKGSGPLMLTLSTYC